jgi:hypothetical protein
MSLSARFHAVARWTPVRWVLLAIGAAFGYLVLANELSLVTTPIAGLLGALVGHGAAHRWPSRPVRSYSNNHGAAAEVERIADRTAASEAISV